MEEFILEYRSWFGLGHLLGLVLGLGGALISDMLFMNFAHRRQVGESEKSALDALSKVVWTGLALLIVSGLALFWPFRDGYLDSPRFLVKMGIVGIILVNGLILSRIVAPRLPSFGSGAGPVDPVRLAWIRRYSPLFGGISAGSWLSAFFVGAMGRGVLADWSLGQLIGAYLAVVVIAIITASVVTRKIFSNIIK